MGKVGETGETGETERNREKKLHLVIEIVEMGGVSESGRKCWRKGYSLLISAWCLRSSSPPPSRETVAGCHPAIANKESITSI